MQKPYHISVLTKEVIEYLAPSPYKVYVDATFGGGGHTRALLESEPTITVISLDWDQTALEMNSEPLEAEFKERFIPLWGSFSHITQLLKKAGITAVDGILADFGTSQYQIAHQEGFSFTVPSPLDMRMSPAHFKTTAADVVNKASEEELADIFYQFGEEYAARKIARLIVSERKKQYISTTVELAQLVMKVVRPYSRSIHPATKVFQALRIFVNDELNNIKSLLTQSLTLLNKEGRIVCISFHSLEDRLVKTFIKDHKDQFHNLTKKVVIPSQDEIGLNPSSRSAKLRAAEKI
jgi:16S rRNA (cytosine1402-N4)-methyltransferase